MGLKNLTNSIFPGNVGIMFTQRWLTGFKRSFGAVENRDRRLKVRKTDIMAEQVRQVLQTADQKLILMVRG